MRVSDSTSILLASSLMDDSDAANSSTFENPDRKCMPDYSFKSSDKTEKWALNHPVFSFHCGDVDEDGIDDILLGVIKKTRFDPLKRKRIFIYRLE